MDSNSVQSVKERLIDVAKGHQDPKDRLWSAIVVLSFLIVIVGFISLIGWKTSQEGNDNLKDGQLIGFQRGVVDCLTTVIDNDRTFDLPDYCRRVEVVQWYPPQVCQEYFVGVAVCGVKWGTG